MSLFRDYLSLLIVIDFVVMKSTGGFPPRRVFRHAGRDVTLVKTTRLFEWSHEDHVINSTYLLYRLLLIHNSINHFFSHYTCSHLNKL
jgi:hypothetical protein